MSEKTEKEPSRHGKIGCKNLNSETSNGIFLNFLFCPLISRKFPDFKSKFQCQNGERNFLIYFTERQWKYIFFFSGSDMQKNPYRQSIFPDLEDSRMVFFGSVCCVLIIYCE
jgi:hypothetical protein